MSFEGVPTTTKRVLDCKQSAVRCVRYNVDGEYCITCGSDKTLKLWNPITGALLQTFTGHGYEVLDCQGSCDNAQVASCGLDKTAILWDVATAVPIRKLRGHAGKVNCIRFNEESSLLLTGSLDSTVRIWDCKSKSKDPIQIFEEAKDSVTSLEISNHEIVTGSLDCIVRRYDLRIGQMFEDTIGKSVSCVKFTKDGQCILTSCLDSTLKLLDKDTGELLGEYSGHKNSEFIVENCLNFTDTHVFSGSEDGNVYIWDLIQSTITKKLEHPETKVVHSLSFHPTQTSLLTATRGAVYLWTDK